MYYVWYYMFWVIVGVVMYYVAWGTYTWKFCTLKALSSVLGGWGTCSCGICFLFLF